MKKIISVSMLIFSMFFLVACSNDNTVGKYDGNDVTTIEVGVYEEYVTVTETNQQEEILSELSKLNYSPADSGGTTNNNYSLRLTFSNNEGCVIYFNFQDNVYSVTPFDSEGKTLHEESKIYSASGEELDELEKMF